MSTHRFKQVQPVELVKVNQQLAVGITASVAGQSPDLTVDVALTDDAALDDLKAYMATLGWSFVTTNPTSPRPTLAAQYQPPVLNKLADPPGSPTPGQRYIVVAPATGDWAGHENEIAEWDGTAWQFTAPSDGMTTWDETEQSPDVYTGSWEPGTPQELSVFKPSDVVLPASNAPSLVTRNDRQMLSFPKPGGLTTGYFPGVVPRSYVATGPLRVKIFWVAETAVAGDARLLAAFERLQPDGPNVDADGFGTNQAENSPTNAVNGLENSTVLNFTNAQANAIKPGNPYRLRVQRAAGAGADTMAGNLQVMRVVVVQ